MGGSGDGVLVTFSAGTPNCLDGVVGWCGGAVPTSSDGASYSLDYSRARTSALTVGAGGGCMDIFALIYPFSPLSPFLWETARYRLIYCLKGPLNPKQPTNRPYCLDIIRARVYCPCSRWYVSDAEASFLDLHLSISDGFVKTKIYDKCDHFDFDIVNFPFLDGDVPRSASYGVYISQLIRFA